MTPPVTLLSPQAVMDRLRQAGAPEWAFLDLREAGEAAEGHPFASVNLPFSRLEADIVALVPRRSTPLVLLDGGDGIADRAAARLQAAGWSDLSIVAGGVPGWVAAGLPLIKGEHSFSKAFGEWVQHSFAVPEIGPDDLAAAMAGAAPPVLVDGRPLKEHRAFTLPGSVNCPNADLGLRLAAAVPAGRAVVVHCAGRTRSIIGAQTLRDFGLPNEVVALRDGTQGWELSGRSREHGADRPVPVPGADEASAAADRARAVMARHAIPALDAAALRDRLADRDRTLYLFDPRPEGEGDCPPGFRRAPGTTLVQQTDRFLAVRGAGVVLWDPLLVRAVFAALWLRRMDVAAEVLTEPPPPLPAVAPPALPPVPAPLSAAALAAAAAKGAALLDLRPAAAFRAGHPAGARRALRPRLGQLGLRQGADVALLGADAAVAALVAADLAGAGCRVLGLNGDDTGAWRAAGLTVIAGPAGPTDDDIDEVRFCAGRHRGVLDDARAYLAWETGLLDRLAAAGLHPWRDTDPEQDRRAGAQTWP